MTQTRGVPVLEVAVDSIPALERALEVGCSRIELCTRLDLDGLSPSRDLFERARAMTELPLVCMVRPRTGHFELEPGELEAMLQATVCFREWGADGIVAGVLSAANAVDVLATRELLRAAAPLPFTFHRAIDQAADPLAAVDQLVELGARRVLSSGGCRTALEGAVTLERMIRRAQGRLTILAGGGVRAHNARALWSQSGVSELHTSQGFTPCAAGWSGPWSASPTCRKLE